jgi:hypothetical protein
MACSFEGRVTRRPFGSAIAGMEISVDEGPLIADISFLLCKTRCAQGAKVKNLHFLLSPARFSLTASERGL